MLANAHQVKGIPGRKTDQSDSEWLAIATKRRTDKTQLCSRKTPA